MDAPTPSPLLFWKEVEKRSAQEFSQPHARDVSTNKLKVLFPPAPPEAPRETAKVDPAAVTGAFNFWKTREVEVIAEETPRKVEHAEPPRAPPPRVQKKRQQEKQKQPDDRSHSPAAPSPTLTPAPTPAPIPVPVITAPAPAPEPISTTASAPSTPAAPANTAAFYSPASAPSTPFTSFASAPASPTLSLSPSTPLFTPPVHSVKLRFLQKSKSTDSISSKDGSMDAPPSPKMRKTREGRSTSGVKRLKTLDDDGNVDVVVTDLRKEFHSKSPRDDTPSPTTERLPSTAPKPASHKEPPHAKPAPLKSGAKVSPNKTPAHKDHAQEQSPPRKETPSSHPHAHPTPHHPSPTKESPSTQENTSPHKDTVPPQPQEPTPPKHEPSEDEGARREGEGKDVERKDLDVEMGDGAPVIPTLEVSNNARDEASSLPSLKSELASQIDHPPAAEEHRQDEERKGVDNNGENEGTDDERMQVDQVGETPVEETKERKDSMDALDLRRDSAPKTRRDFMDINVMRIDSPETINIPVDSPSVKHDTAMSDGEESHDEGHPTSRTYIPPLSPSPPSSPLMSPPSSPSPPPQQELLAAAVSTAVSFVAAMDQIDESISDQRHGKNKGVIAKRKDKLKKFINLRVDTEKEAKEKAEKEKDEKKDDKKDDKKEKDEKKEKDDKKEKEKEKDKDKAGKRKSIFKKDKKGSLIISDPAAPSSPTIPSSPRLTPTRPAHAEGQIFGVELELLPCEKESRVPMFVWSVVQILTESDREDVDYLFFDSETNPKILPLKTQLNAEQLDITKVYEHVLVAGLLKTFFVELPSPLVPQHLYKDFVDLQEISDTPMYIGYSRALLWAMPVPQRVLLQFLIKFLREKYLKNPANSKDYVVNKLGAAFGPILLRPDENGKSIANAVCRYIITNYEALFVNLDLSDSKYAVRSDALVLQHATLERYTERLLDWNYNESEFWTMFFTVRPCVLTPNAFLDLLHPLYISSTTQSSKTKHPAATKNWKHNTSSRILDLLRHWLEHSYFDLREDKALMTRISRDFPLLETNSKALQHAAAAAAPKAPVSFSNQVGGGRVRSQVLDKGGNSIPLLETSAVELAHHLTMVDFDLFAAVKPIEWLKYTEPFSSPDKKFPHLYAFQKQHSQWEYWTATEILKEPQAPLRAMRIAQFINVALICRELNNQCTALALIAGLTHPAIKRLDNTWKGLPKESAEKFQSLLDWYKVETEKNVPDILESLRLSKKPFLPSPFTLHRLISLLNTSHPLHPNSSPNLFDLDRLRIIFALMKTFQQILSNTYAMKATPRLYIQLQEVSVLSGDQLMYQSMKCEPPQSPTERRKLNIPPSTSNPGNNVASAGLLISSTPTYKVPEALNNWKGEIRRIFNKPVEQLPIGIDLPRLATSILVETEPMNIDGDVLSPPSSPRGGQIEAPGAEEQPDTRAREIMNTLSSIGRLVEGDEYAQGIIQNFGNFVTLDGAKDRDMSREIATLVGEFLGKDSKVVKVLKACNQAIIAPAVIELTLNVGTKVPFNDAGGWKMMVSRNTEGQVTVTHVKQQKQRSSNKEEAFNFEWHLEMIFDVNMTGLADVFLSVPRLNFGPAMSQSKMEGIQYTFAPYLVRR